MISPRAPEEHPRSRASRTSGTAPDAGTLCDGLPVLLQQKRVLLSYRDMAALACASSRTRECVEAVGLMDGMREASKYASCGVRSGVSVFSVMGLSLSLGSFVHRSLIIEAFRKDPRQRGRMFPPPPHSDARFSAAYEAQSAEHAAALAWRA